MSVCTNQRFACLNYFFFVHQSTVTRKSHTLQLKVKKNKGVQAKATTHILDCLCCFKMKNAPLSILVYVFFSNEFFFLLQARKECECLIKGYWDFTDDNKILSSKSSREDMCRLPTSFLLNIQSRVKQEVDMPQIQKCVTRYSSPYWCSVSNIRELACVVAEKNMTKFFCDADADDDARRRKTTEMIPICRLR